MTTNTSEQLHWRLVKSLRLGIAVAVRKSLKPPPRLNLVEWADEYRYLPDNSAEAGKWRTDRVEAARGPMLSITDPDVQEVTVMCCIQLMKTELMINTALYYMHQEPSPIMYVATKKEIAEAWSKERFSKSVDATPVTRDIFNKNRRGEGNTILQKQFPGGQISIVSARNPDDLAMRACRIMLFDEVDKYPLNVGASGGGAGGEGDPIGVAWGRATTFGRRAKKIVACSPTTEGRSRVHQEYLAGDQREFHQPCPHCDHAEPLVWEKHVVIPNDEHGQPAPDHAYIVCHECGTKWTEGDRIKSIRNAFWVAKRPEVTHHHSYVVSSLGSPFTPLVTLAREFVRAGDNPQLQKAFENTRLSRVYRERGEAPDWQRLYERRDTYKHGTVPKGGLIVVCGIDVQKDYLIYEVVAFGRKLRSWSIDIGVIEGHISEEKTKEELGRFLEATYESENGASMGIELALIDSSNDTQEVYSTVAQLGTPRLRAIKGQANLTTAVGTPRPVQINIDGIRRDGGIKMWPVGVSVLKEQFYKWLMMSRPTDESLEKGAEWPRGYCHFPEWDEDYFKQITAEILVERADRRGFLVKQWEKIREHNHYLDCRIYARAAAAMLGIDRMDDNDWARREMRFGASDPESKNEQEVIKAAPSNAPVTAKPRSGRPRKKRPARFFNKSRR